MIVSAKKEKKRKKTPEKIKRKARKYKDNINIRRAGI